MRYLILAGWCSLKTHNAHIHKLNFKTMSDVHGNPDEMRQFAFHLNKLAMDFRGLKDSTRAKMNYLNQSWRDKENSEFVQQFEQDVKPLDKLIDTAEKYSAFLKKKASKLDDFNNTKLGN